MLGMSNAFGGGVVTPMSLELAQWYCWEGLFRLVAFSRAHHWTGLLRGLDLSHYLPWTVTTLLGSASPGLQLRWSFWEGVT